MTSNEKQLKIPISVEGREKWAELEKALKPLLTKLWSAASAVRLDHVPRITKEPGIYLFVDENLDPIYVGQTRNLRSRLAAHTRPSGSHNSASFAFLLAKDRYTPAEGEKMTRAELEAHPEFMKLFRQAKEDVSKMEARFVSCADPELRTVFEVYAAMHLGTEKFNSFETH